MAFCAGCGNSVSAGEKFCRVCGKEIPASAVITPAAVPAETSGKAIVSLVCGLFLFAFPLSILAIFFGHISLSEIRKSAGRLTGEGMAIAGLVLGYAGVAVIPILIIAAIAIPNLLRARIAANESSAVAVVRRLVAAEAVYSRISPRRGIHLHASRSVWRWSDRRETRKRTEERICLRLAGMQRIRRKRGEREVSSGGLSSDAEHDGGTSLLHG